MADGFDALDYTTEMVSTPEGPLPVQYLVGERYLHPLMIVVTGVYTSKLFSIKADLEYTRVHESSERNLIAYRREHEEWRDLEWDPDLRF